MTEPTPPETKRKAVSLIRIQPQRPDPPPQLSPQEAEIWVGTVNAMRADWFLSAPAQALLRAFCTQCVLADDIEVELRALRRKRKYDVARYDALALRHGEACKTILQLAGKLRLTPLSNRQSIRDARVTPSRKPWEIVG